MSPRKSLLSTVGHKKQTNPLCEHNAEFLYVTARDTYSDHLAFMA
jgi:hypothetical protein